MLDILPLIGMLLKHVHSIFVLVEEWVLAMAYAA